MLDWIKRIAGPQPRAEIVELIVPEPEVISAEVTHAKVEQLAARLALPKPSLDPILAMPAPRVIAVVSQKGGSGKTTIAAHLAVRAAALGEGPVLLADTDPQGSLTQWWRERNDDNFGMASLKLDDLQGNLIELRRHGASLAIIDTPPALTASIEQIIALADLVIVPARPSPHDLRAVGATVAMARAARKPFLFVVNGAAPRASITAEAVAALSAHGRVAPVILYQRTEFAASMVDGRTVMEATPNGRSAQEITELWKHISAQMTMREAA